MPSPLLDEALKTIRDSKHVKKALTHPSFSEGRGNSEDYNELKHLGDAVWDLAVLEMIYSDEKIQAKEADEKKQKIVSEEGQAPIAVSLDLVPQIRVGKGAQGIKENRSILADTLEAIVGAIFLEKGYDETKKHIVKWIKNAGIG